MYRLPCLAAVAWLSTGVLLRAQDLPDTDAELKRLAGGGKECATWELRLAKGLKERRISRVTLTFHKTRLGASVTPIYVATLAVDHAGGAVARGFSYQLEAGRGGKF